MGNMEQWARKPELLRSRGPELAARGLKADETIRVGLDSGWWVGEASERW
jgi:hypothetical protein